MLIVHDHQLLVDVLVLALQNSGFERPHTADEPQRRLRGEYRGHMVRLLGSRIPADLNTL